MLFVLLIILGIIFKQKLMNIHINTHNYIYNRFI
jgi:hypothetical protein